MSRKGCPPAGGAVFPVLSIAHLTRLASGWEIAIAGDALPRWLSLPGPAVTGLLATRAFSPARKEGS
jgi:hypothetical protein